MYELVLVLAITWAGPGHIQRVEFPNKHSCYEALRNMRIEGLYREAGEDSKEVVAYCRPLAKEVE